MDELIGSTKKEVLVEMVKLSQKKGMKGSKGDWKEFLKSHDKKLGSSLSDPSRRSVESLAAFIKTFEQEADVKFFQKVSQCHSNIEEVEQFKITNPKKETAEQGLVRLTLEHPQYPIDYSFPSYEEDWVVVMCSKKTKAMKSTKMIAIDCEMALCEDGTEALVKVCAVDRNLKVKLEQLVNPNKPIADYRTDITGITATDLKGVTHSLNDVQIYLKKLLSHGTILVGHSLNNDLQVLKLEHTRVIDTSYIFKNDNGTNKKPSLSLLCKALLGFELRKEGKPHNCVDDACAAMKLVLARLEGKIGGNFGAPVTDVVKISDVVSDAVSNVVSGVVSGVAKLLVHRIPFNIIGEDLKSVLPANCTIEKKVSTKVGPTYSVFAVFKNQQEAIAAFDNFKGTLEKDTNGRPQKLVKFKLDSGKAGVFCVCNTLSKGADTKKRPAEDAGTPVMPKKLRTDQISEAEDSNNCELHLREIARLKEVLSQRDEEISNLSKIIASLARKQGL